MALYNVWDDASVDWPDVDRDNPDNVFVEVGGFEGRWVAEMAARYAGTFHVYEPQTWAHERIQTAFELTAREGARLELHSYGLGPQDDYALIGGFETDAASFLKTPDFYRRHPEEGRRRYGYGEIRSVWSCGIREIESIDVMMMNIEGYEYILIPALHRAGILPRIRNLAVQFHRDYREAQDEPEVLAAIAETHDVLWSWPALTAWALRGNASFEEWRKRYPVPPHYPGDMSRPFPAGLA